jgi:hypothetical protein
MSVMAAWSTIIRFKDEDGAVHHGEPIQGLAKARVWKGTSIFALDRTDQLLHVVEVSMVLRL